MPASGKPVRTMPGRAGSVAVSLVKPQEAMALPPMKEKSEAPIVALRL